MRKVWPKTLPWCAAAIGALIYALSFYPGNMSFDSAYLYWQARGGETSNSGSPALIWVWRALEPIIPGPGGIFLLHIFLFWLGLALIAIRWSKQPIRQGVFLFVVPAAPVIFVLYTHVWTDVGLMSSLTCAVACVLHYRDSARKYWLIALSFCLLYALAMRHNALPAVAPFIFYSVYLYIFNRISKISISRLVALGCASLFGLITLVSGINRTVDHDVTLWPSLQLWDLAALSIASEQQLLPNFSVGPTMTVEDLRQAFRPWSNTPLFAQTQTGIREPVSSIWTDQERDALTSAWLNAILTYPGAYFSHRARLMAALFGTHPAAWPRELIYFDGQLGYQDNPTINPNTSAMHAFWLRVFDYLRDTPLLAAWPYLIIMTAALLLILRHPSRPNARAAILVLTSGLLYTVPYFFLAPAAELRYLGWTCLSAMLGMALITDNNRPQLSALS